MSAVILGLAPLQVSDGWSEFRNFRKTFGYGRRDLDGSVCLLFWQLGFEDPIAEPYPSDPLRDAADYIARVLKKKSIPAEMAK